jgi:hypothetical protein
MRWQVRFLLVGLVWVAPFAQIVLAATKIHVIAFGKSMSVPWLAGTGAEKEKPLLLKVRALIIDGSVKEYVIGAPHEITDRLFAVRRAFRVNDSLPEASTPRWQWQTGGWLIVDRLTGCVSAITLPEFDSFYSSASCYRDYVAYCGVADDGKKIDAVVAQIGRRKPVRKKSLSSDGAKGDAEPDSACLAPVWQRNPTPVSFEAAGAETQTFALRGQVVDVVNDAEEEEDAPK